MTRWLSRVLGRIHECALAGRVAMTSKATRELATLGIGLDADDVRWILAGLTPSDSAGRLRSKVLGEWLYVFKPQLSGARIYLKVVLRAECIVVSFHEDFDEHPR